MLGTFGGALEARHIDASNGKLVGEVTGEVETEEGVLVIRRIHVAMRLVAPEAGPRNRGTRARPLRDALSPVSHIAQRDPAHIVFHVGKTRGLTQEPEYCALGRILEGLSRIPSKARDRLMSRTGSLRSQIRSQPCRFRFLLRS